MENFSEKGEIKPAKAAHHGARFGRVFLRGVRLVYAVRQGFQKTLRVQLHVKYATFLSYFRTAFDFA